MNDVLLGTWETVLRDRAHLLLGERSKSEKPNNQQIQTSTFTQRRQRPDSLFSELSPRLGLGCWAGWKWKRVRGYLDPLSHRAFQLLHLRQQLHLTLKSPQDPLRRPRKKVRRAVMKLDPLIYLMLLLHHLVLPFFLLFILNNVNRIH